MNRLLSSRLNGAFLTGLLFAGSALTGSFADAARRSGGGFGGSRSSGSTYSAPRYTPPAPRYTPPRNSGTTSPYTAPRTTSPSTSSSTGSATTRTPSAAQRRSLPSNASVAGSAANRAAAARVSASQLSGWKNVKLPAGVPRSAITYSATPSAQYRHQLAPGRYYPYPQSYYKQRNIGYDILKYALIFTAVSSVADALDGPDVVVNNVGTAPAQTGNELDGVNYNSQATPPAPAGPNLWTYVGVGFFAAAAGWFVLGRRR